MKKQELIDATEASGLSQSAIGYSFHSILAMLLIPAAIFSALLSR